MSHQADKDLNSQQQHLSSTSYDLRITNLARFIYQLILTCHSGLDPESRKKKTGSPIGVGDDTSTFFDVGAGNGLFLKFFKQKGFTVSGIELEKKLVANMKKDPELKGVTISQGDITKIAHPRGGSAYNVVLASDVIEHIKDDKLAIAHLWSHVAPGGLMVITVPAHSHLYGKRDKMWGHYRRYDKDVLLERIQEGITNHKAHSSHPELVSGSRKNKTGSSTVPAGRQVGVEDDKQYTIEFITHWNIVGYFIYFLYEKILHKSINEKMRYSDSMISKFVRLVLDLILKFEELVGGLPLGLTLVAVVRKKAINE